MLHCFLVGGASNVISIASHHDLLGDDDDVGHTSSPLQDQSAEIGNTQNQLNSTNRSLDAAKQERATIEQTLANQASQMSALQTQLSLAKATYETETKLLATLKERHSGQLAEMQKSREELIRAESDLSAVRVEKSEIEGAFLRDKEEARDLHRKMVEAGQQVEALKLEVEKTKKDAKQQKGLLAIARKQLSTKEAERAKVEKELDEATAEVTSIVKDKDVAEAELAQLSTSQPTTVSNIERGLSSDSVTFAASQALPISPDPSSPAGSAKSNNPFDRLTKSSGQSTPRSQSPFLPFSGASIPTPSANGATADTSSNAPSFDPFGFSQAFESDQPSQDVLRAASPAISISQRSTPKPADIDTSRALPVLSPSSPHESDQFVTPPTTANIRTPQVSPSPPNPADSIVPQLHALDDAASHFPDIEAVGINGQSPTVPTEEGHTETDLSAGLKELEVDESDSDSDSDDEIPLADLAKGKIAESPSVPAPTMGQPEVTNVSFDDIFGVTPPTAAVAPPEPFSVNGSSDVTKPSSAASPFESSHINATSPVASVVPPETHTPAIAGVNAFDEAMGAIPNNTSPVTTQQFTFDSAFDDNFDFPSATETPFPPAPTNATTGSKNNGFDSVFMTPARNGAPVISSATVYNEPTPFLVNEAPAKSESPKPTFDEAFSGFDSGPALDLRSSFSLPTAQEAIPKQSSANSPTAFPASTSPKAEPTSPRVVPPRPASPSPRAKSPPLRTASPKPRLSSSSSKDAPEKHEEPTTRRSKLSVCSPPDVLEYN